MKIGTIIISGILLVFVVIQLIPNELPPVKAENPQDLLKSDLISESVGKLIRRSCYSCHSNETEYPWYSYVAPSSWLVAKDVREGREALNFSDWESLEMLDKLALLDDVVIEVQEGTMPMGIYTWMHPSAKLSDEQRIAIIDWAEEAMDIIVEEDEEEWEEDAE
ncbi:MAG: heme-binding domain-containing protein [Lunatimonas sp.]|nr:heme-binding domain-containing protein [Lunatimonas sp.]